MAVKTFNTEFGEFSISYTLKNIDCSKDILFLHGWGSNKELMQSVFKDTFSQYRHVYIDLPGFGDSSNDYILNSFEYSNIISAFLEQLSSSPEIIVGHSFGGKVATLLNPKYMILLSSSGILEPKKTSVRIKIFLAKIFRFLGLSFLNTKLASKDANNLSHVMYETFKNIVKEDFTRWFSGFSNKAYIFWGRDDRATVLASGKKIHELIKNSEIEVIEGDHYFFLKNKDSFLSKLASVEAKIGH